MQKLHHLRQVAMIAFIMAIFIVSQSQPVEVGAQGLVEYLIWQLRIPLDHEPTTLNPLEMGADRPTYLVVNQIYESFFRIKPDGFLEPAGATDLSISEDGLVYTIYLREDARWSDGELVVAQHYIDGLLAMGKADLGESSFKENFFIIQGFQGWSEGTITDPDDVGILAIDDYTLEIHLTTGAAHFPYLLASSRVKFAVRLDENGDILPLYNGAYQLEAWQPGDYIELVKNPYYWDTDNVQIQSVYMPIIPDLADQFAAYKNGELDVSGYPGGDVAEIQADPILLAEQFTLPYGIFYIALNPSLPPTDDLDLRIALAASIDRASLLAGANKPFSYPATGIIPPGMAAYQGEAVGYPYDLSLASGHLQAYMNAQGISDPGDISLEIWSTTGSIYSALIPTIAQMWRDNLEVTVVVIEDGWNEYMGKLDTCRADPFDSSCTYNGYRLGWLGGINDPWIYLHYVFHPLEGWAPHNWDNSDYRDLLTTAKGTHVDSSRNILYQEAEKILVEDDAAVIPLTFIDQELLIKSYIDFEYPGEGMAPYIQNWSITSLSVTNSSDSGQGSLRQAITYANQRPGLDFVEFQIPTSECAPETGVCTIQPLSALPEIGDPIIIDGYSQAGASLNTNPMGLGSNAQLKIELDGSSVLGGGSGLHFTAGPGLVRGLVINRFPDDGIHLQSATASGIHLEGNFIGTDPTGTFAEGEQYAGIRINDAPENIVGNGTAEGINLLSGNTLGVVIQGPPGINNAVDNQVSGNLIGTNASGTVPLGNLNHGVFIGDATNNTVGPGNLISGNLILGILLIDDASGNRVIGNYIGTDISGTSSLANFIGVHILGANDNTIGGDMPAERNVLSGNTTEGVLINGGASTSNIVQGNYIGTDFTGTAPLPNSGNGIRLDIQNGSPSNNLIGGIAPGEGNLISANFGVGIILANLSQDNRLEGNLIGTDISGSLAMGNLGNGIHIHDSSGTLIRRNQISFNAGDGITIEGVNAIANTISENAVHANMGKGISLIGGNEQLASPVISNVLGDYFLGTAPSGSLVEVFADSNGEGRSFLGSTFADPSSGEFTYSGPLSGPNITATATDSSGNTSEFSVPVQWAADNCEPNNLFEQACDAEEVLDLTFESLGSFESYISGPQDVDWFFFDLPEGVLPGSQISISLSGSGGTDLPANFDLAILAELETDPQTGASPLQGVPLQGVPLQGVPLQGVPLQGVDAEGVPLQGVPLQGVTVNDIPLQGVPLQGVPLQGVPLQGVPLQGVPLQGVGFHQGSQPEEILTLFRGGMTGRYYVMVWSSSGEFSNDPGSSPYEVTVTWDGVTAQACSTALDNVEFSDPLDQPLGNTSDPLTLILINKPRMVALYGEGSINALMDVLVNDGDSNLASHERVQGMIVDLASFSAVREAYSNWDANGCDPEAANLVTLAIKNVINDLLVQYASIQNLVMVGNDLVIPMRRVPDEIVRTEDGATVPNEYDYVKEQDDGSRTVGMVETGNSPTFATLQLQYYLSDDFYADRAPILLDHGHELSVPDIPSGRLVETPEEITGYFEVFMARNGLLVGEQVVPSLTTGYSFLSDQADAIDEILTFKGFSPAVKLNSENWQRADFISALSAQEIPPSVNSINGHTDHRQLAPPVFEVEGDLLKTEDEDFITSDFAGSLLFSVGCHMGFNFIDQEIPGATPLGAYDFSQALIGHGGTLIGNWGYGYGDDAALAYSEELMTEFARQLGNSTLGHSLVEAKREYILNQVLLDPVHEKVLMEAILYGLPMWEVTLPGQSPVEGVNVQSTQDLLGDLSTVVYDVSVNPGQLTDNPVPGRGTFYSLAGRTQAAVFHPLQPKASIPVTGGQGEVAHGVLFTGGNYFEMPNIDPVITMPAWTRSLPEPQFVYEGWDPPRFWSLAQIQDSAEQYEERLVMIPGQFLVDREATINSGTTIGMQRLYENMQFQVVYGPQTGEFLPPVISSVRVVQSSNPGVTILVKVEDPETDLIPSSGVLQVLITYTEIGGENIWYSPALEEIDPLSGLWAGILDVNGEMDFFVQAVDGSGNVGMFAGNGYFSPVAVDISGPGAALVGQPVSFTAHVANELSEVNYLWDFGDGSRDAGQSTAVHTFSEAGPFTVSVRVADRDGNLGEATMEILVETASDPSLHDMFTRLFALQYAVEGLEDDAFRSSAEDRRYSLVVKFSEVGGMIFTGNYEGAINKLTNDILKKMDGCPAEADKTDWILDCEFQLGLQDQIFGLIEAIEANLP
ncbi:MAG: right-handed parallel beta-helix repeat-containing protein [Chloroflexota bacterium]|nr:MAG: right-handed parallel beta-helix repeat-containing protein [Chloroflexota bacterium]